MNVWVASVTLLQVFVFNSALPDGAPSSACSSMEPVHSGMSAQRDSAPYSVTVEELGKAVRITISSPIGEEFQGFMLQARSSRDPDKFIDGEFFSSPDIKAVDCFNLKKNTLTHAKPSPKTDVRTDWTPRGSVNEDVIFRATVLKSYAVFWTKIDSRPMPVVGSDTTTDEGTSLLPIDGCFSSKGCFGLPAGCASSGDCDVLLTYTQVEDGIHFSLHGFLQPSTYMAMALSLDKKMGDDAVTGCVRGENDIVTARESWNEGKKNRFLRELPRSDYESLYSYISGLTYCSWTANYLLRFNNITYDLANNNYYLLLAKGESRNGPKKILNIRGKE